MAYALTRMLRTLAVAFAAAAVLLALAIGSAPRAEAHGLYSAICCSDFDCSPVSDSAVHEAGDTIVIRVLPGQHPMWGKDKTEPFVAEIQRSALQEPIDGRWHACISPSGKLLCVYPPLRSF
jgi:hypothetical protein